MYIYMYICIYIWFVYVCIYVYVYSKCNFKIRLPLKELLFITYLNRFISLKNLNLLIVNIQFNKKYLLNKLKTHECTNIKIIQ